MGVVIVAQPPSLFLQAYRFPLRLSSRIRPCFSSRRWLNTNSTLRRLDSYKCRCSTASTDVFDHVKTDEEAEDNCSAAASDCPVPFIQLKSDILETESLDLLAKGTYVDTLLIKLPVLSEEEQNVIAGIPAHPAGLHVLFASCLAGNLVEQLWNFAWPAAIALLYPSLLPVAITSFFTKLAVIVGAPVVGNLMDHFPRVPTYNCLTITQAACQLLSVGMITYAHSMHRTNVSFLLRPWFVILIFSSAVERLCGLALGVAMERDWVVLLAGTNRPIALAQANATLSRIDLLCEIAGASLFGILLSRYEPVSCLKLAAGLMIGTLPVLLSLTWLTNKLSTGVLDRARSPQTYCKSSSVEAHGSVKNIVERSVEAIKHGWIEYTQQPVLPASLAYVLLCFNIVLTPGGLMTVFLTRHGLNPSIIGGFSGLCAFTGVAATFASAEMVKRFGVLKAGAVGLVLQALLLTLAVAVYWSGSLSQRTPILFFLSLIVLSKLGHMSYDVVGAQILQTGIPASKANIIGATEVSIASLAESAMLGVAIIANDVSHFGILAILSLISVVGAALLFCQWLKNPTDIQRSLFSFDKSFDKDKLHSY